MSQRNYSFKDIICLLGGIQAYGFADGDDAIITERIEDVATMTQGCDNWATISKNAATGIKITLKLLDTSPFNGILNNTLTTMDALGTIVPIPFYLKDINGLDLVQADKSVISKCTTLQYGKSSNVRSWELLAANPVYFAGGHPII